MSAGKIYTSKNNFNDYFKGTKLYGDDFSIDQIKDWFKNEREGYANLGAKNKEKYKYAYHGLNKLHGYKYLPKIKYKKALGFGSAYGDELKPFIKYINDITILEPSDSFIQKYINGKPVRYVKPNYDGVLPFNNNSFDIITCFGVLHHIPNVSKVINEIYRCLKIDGYCLIREPIVSMGDWRYPRKGLTLNERGIPLNIFRNILKKSGFKIIKEKKCVFSLTSHISKLISYKLPYNSKFVVFLDNLLCNIFSFNYSYHANNWIKKIRPISIYYVLKK